MKVLHITTSDFGGAGLCALRIHKALLGKGGDSKMLVAHKSSDVPLVFEAEESDLNKYIPPQNKFARKYEKLMRKRGKYLTELERYKHSVQCLSGKAFYTFPLSNYDLSSHPLAKEADLIHLHWVANFVDYPTFFKNVNKPIVWTLHDLNIAFGGFHYQYQKDKYYDLCISTEDELSRIKTEALLRYGNRIHLVAISSMMRLFCQNTPAVSSFPVTMIHNGVEEQLFVPIDKETARQVLHIPENNTVFVFCAQSLSDANKGLRELLSAFAKMDLKNVTLLCAGSGELPEKTNINVIKLGMLQNERLLSLFYSAADFFVMPSFQEAFAQTPLEAMACGVPVIAFPCSGAKDLITEQNGVVCEDFTVENLVNGIKEAMNKEYDSENIRQDIIHRFSYKKIAGEYMDLYDKMLSC